MCNKTDLIHKALLIRKVEEKLLELFKEGELNGTVHTCIGQELTGVCLAENLSADDYILSNHRGHGHLLSREGDLVGFFAELMGRKDGLCGGKGGSQHIYRENFLSNGLQGGMVPIAAGIAFANKILSNGKIACCFIGDGTLGEGVIYESFNIASKWELPVVYILENNKIAQSTPIEQTFCGSIQQRAHGFGMNYLKANTWDVESLLEVFSEAVENAKENCRPTLVEVETFRLYSHSKGDDNRDKSTITEYLEKDLVHQYLTESKNASEVSRNIEVLISEAADKAKESKKLTDVEPPCINDRKIQYHKLRGEKSERINDLIYAALKQQFQNCPESVLLGEDIEYLTPFTCEPYGGAFKVSKDLSERFSNVKNTPISEAAIVGIGSGLALAGLKPIVEIMFGDFITLAFDQIFNHACKFRLMYNEQVTVPLVIRTPMGGKRGYGPTHSQSIEKFFLGIPDLTVVALNHRISPRKIYTGVFKEESPVLVIENKVLYTKKLDTQPLDGFTIEESDEKYPTLKIAPENETARLTILCYGEILETVENAVGLAFFEEEILCEIICPSKISPVNMSPIVESLRRTGALVTVEEGTSFASYSAEIAARITESNIPLRSLKRISNNHVIPSSFAAEIASLPCEKTIFEAIKGSIT